MRDGPHFESRFLHSFQRCPANLLTEKNLRKMDYVAHSRLRQVLRFGNLCINL